ncbi:MAG: PilN domain-containing protein [Candidatus Magasanikbacteria bacterium]
MYKTRINLLSPEKQKFLDKMIVFQFIKNTLDISIFSLCIISIILLGGEIILQEHFNVLAQQTAQTTSRYSVANKHFQEINTILENTEKIQKEYYPWTETLNSLASALPDGVTLDNISLDRGQKKIVFSGLANTRENLLLFEQNLNTLPFMNEIKVPLTQLTQKELVPFNLTSSLK